MSTSSPDKRSPASLASTIAGHLPGPWDFLIDGDWPMVYSSAHDPEDGHRLPVIDMFHGGYDFTDFGYPLAANGRLIAAAPELLEALQKLRTALDLIDPSRPLQYAQAMDLMRKCADAAIAKAQGEN